MLRLLWKCVMIKAYISGARSICSIKQLNNLNFLYLRDSSFFYPNTFLSGNNDPSKSCFYSLYSLMLYSFSKINIQLLYAALYLGCLWNAQRNFQNCKIQGPIGQNKTNDLSPHSSMKLVDGLGPVCIFHSNLPHKVVVRMKRNGLHRLSWNGQRETHGKQGPIWQKALGCKDGGISPTPGTHEASKPCVWELEASWLQEEGQMPPLPAPFQWG